MRTHDSVKRDRLSLTVGALTLLLLMAVTAAVVAVTALIQAGAGQ